MSLLIGSAAVLIENEENRLDLHTILSGTQRHPCFVSQRELQAFDVRQTHSIVRCAPARGWPHPVIPVAREALREQHGTRDSEAVEWDSEFSARRVGRHRRAPARAVALDERKMKLLMGAQTAEPNAELACLSEVRLARPQAILHDQRSCIVAESATVEYG